MSIGIVILFGFVALKINRSALTRIGVLRDMWICIMSFCAEIILN